MNFILKHNQCYYDDDDDDDIDDMADDSKIKSFHRQRVVHIKEWDGK